MKKSAKPPEVNPAIVKHFEECGEILAGYNDKHELLRFLGPNTGDEAIQREFIRRFLDHPRANNLADALLLCSNEMLRAALKYIRF